MKKIFMLPLLIVTLFVCCKKEKQKQFSYWYVNTDSFKTNNVTLDGGYSATVLNSHDLNNNFTLSGAWGLPTSGAFDIANSHIAYLNFYYKDTFYTIAQDQYITASLRNGKSSYQLPPTKFVSYDNSSDTVLISGTFNQP